MTKTENEEIIHLKVKSNDHEEIFFKIKKVTPLKKLMEKYCERMGLSNLNNVRFLFDGERIVPSNTPAQLNMQNGDEIDVYVEQHGGLLKGTYCLGNEQDNDGNSNWSRVKELGTMEGEVWKHG
jgi:small ubiquitin-related modifier